jgi:hypothetical protein
MEKGSSVEGGCGASPRESRPQPADFQDLRFSRSQPDGDDRGRRRWRARGGVSGEGQEEGSGGAGTPSTVDGSVAGLRLMMVAFSSPHFYSCLL